METITIDGVAHEFPDEAVPHVRKLFSDLADITAKNLLLAVEIETAQREQPAALAAADEAHALMMADFDRQHAAKDAEIAHLRRAIIDAEREIIETSDVWRDARTIAPDVPCTGGKLGIMRAALATIIGEEAHRLSDAYACARFDLEVRNRKRVADEEARRPRYVRDALGDAIANSLPGANGRPIGDTREGAYERMCDDLANAWKTRH